MSVKQIRQQAICELISNQAVYNQEQLVQLLADQGIETTQTTLSRDLNELAIYKGRNGYECPGNNKDLAPQEESLAKVLKQYMLSLEQAANLLVLKTPPGRAMPVGYELDNCEEPLIVGNIAGDDTIFVATRSNQDATELQKILLDLRDMN